MHTIGTTMLYLCSCAATISHPTIKSHQALTHSNLFCHMFGIRSVAVVVVVVVVMPRGVVCLCAVVCRVCGPPITRTVVDINAVICGHTYTKSIYVRTYRCGIGTRLTVRPFIHPHSHSEHIGATNESQIEPGHAMLDGHLVVKCCFYGD